MSGFLDFCRRLGHLGAWLKLWIQQGKNLGKKKSPSGFALPDRGKAGALGDWKY
jgi:hypothetical protein